MIDREKVIKALECCVFPVSKGFPYQSHIADKSCEVIECQYRDDCDQLLLDALELLKAQKPMPVLSQRECETLQNHYERKGFCPKCNQVVEWYLNRSYCGFCGQAVKWE